MSALATRLHRILETCARGGRAAIEGIAAVRRRRADARARAICPTDSLAFTPLYTEGACPLCGWTPQGYVYAPPALTPYDRYWGAMAAIAAASAVMCIVVVVAMAKG